MSTIEERTAYLDNPYFTKHIYGDFTTFYVVITICAIFGVFLAAVNIICGCCSKHRQYWQDRHTGNRWVVSLWTTTPHKQPPLDLTELKDVKIEYPSSIRGETEQKIEYTQVTHHKSKRGGSGYREEFVELHKRESEI